MARLNNNNSNDNYSNNNNDNNNSNNNNSNSNNKGQFFYSLTKISKVFFIFAKKKSLENLYFIEQSGTDNLYSCTKTEIFKNSFI